VILTYWEKKALFGAAVRGAGGALLRGAGNFGKGLFGAGPLASAGMGGKAVNFAGKATGVVAPVASAMGAGEGASFLGMGGKKAQASLTGSPVLDHIAVKVARMGALDVLEEARSGALEGAPKLASAHDNTTLTRLALRGSALYDRSKAP